MTLPVNPNQISLSQIQTEFGGAAPTSLSEYYSAGAQVPQGSLGFPGGTTTQIPTSGQISFSNFHGATLVTPVGIFSGGSDSTPANRNSVNKMPFSTETITLLSTTLSRAGGPGSAGNGITKSFLFNMSDGTNVYAEIRRMTYSTDTMATISAVTNNASQLNATATSSSHVYILLAFSVSTLDKFNKSAETMGTVGAAISTPTSWGAGLQSSTKGYFCAGATAYDPKTGYTGTNIIRSINFSNDSQSTLSAVTTASGQIYGSFSTPSTGYFTFFSSGWNKLDFSTEAISNGKAHDNNHFPSANYGQLARSSTKGYFLTTNGGTNNAITGVLQTYIISNDTYGGVLASTMSPARTGVSAAHSAYF